MRFALRATLALAALGVIGVALVHQLPDTLPQLVPAWLAAAVALRAVAVSASAMRWGQILRVLGHSEVGRRESLVFTLESAWLSLALPSSVGGDAWRVARIRGQVPLTRAIAASVIDRALGAVIFAGVAAWSYLSREVALPSAAPWLATAGTGLAAVLVWQGRSRLRRASMLIRNLRAARIFSWGAASFWAGCCAAAQIASHVAIAGAIGLRIPSGVLLGTVPLILLGRALPLTPSGIGIGEAVSALLLAEYASPEQAITFAFLGLAAGVPVALIGGALMLAPRPQRASP